MQKAFRNILINSTLAFVSAFVITTFIHESGHYLSYLIFGADPTLFHNYVQTASQDLPVHARIISALAGPLISLVQGILFWVVISRNSQSTARNLFFLWMSLLGLVNFFGYLVMTPLSTVGDTGKAASLLGLDSSIRIVVAVAGFAMLMWSVLKIGRSFSNFIPADLDREKRTKYVYSVMFFPIMIGSVVNTLLAFPVVALLSIIYPATSAYVIMSSFPVILKPENRKIKEPEFADRIMRSLLFLALAAIFVNRLLTLGFG